MSKDRDESQDHNDRLNDVKVKTFTSEDYDIFIAEYKEYAYKAGWIDSRDMDVIIELHGKALYRGYFIVPLVV